MSTGLGLGYSRASMTKRGTTKTGPKAGSPRRTRSARLRQDSTWTHARIPAPAEAEDAVAALCLELGAPGVQTGERDLRRSTGKSARPARIRIEAWFPPAIPRARLERALNAGLERIHRAFPGLRPERVRVAPFEVGDYGSAWRENFPPLRIG